MRYNKEKALVRGKKKDKAFVRIFGGIFVLVGIILFTVCIFIYTSGHTFKAEATPVQAVILAMRGANHESLGTPVVEYTVGGKTYTSTLNLSSSSMHPGKQITVYYRNGNPQEVRYLDDNNFTGDYRKGNWYFQHFHDEKSIKKLLEDNGFEIQRQTFGVYGDSFQVEAKKIRSLTTQEYIDAIDFEFNLPLPGGNRYGRNQDVKEALGLVVGGEECG